MKNGRSKICDCGASPCLSHKYHGRYRCMQCVDSTIRNAILCKHQTLKDKVVRTHCITELLKIDGHNLLCVYRDDKLCIWDGVYYYSIDETDYFGDCTVDYFEDNSQCIWSDRTGTRVLRLYRNKQPVNCNVYLFLSYADVFQDALLCLGTSR